MEVYWWRVPGPGRFLRTVIQDLRSGKNVVLAFPPFAPDGFSEALAEQVRDNDSWRWRSINAEEYPSDGVANLTEALHYRFVPSPLSSELCTALTLAKRLVGTIIWVENVAEQAWQTWFKFLAQYQHACQSCDLFERSLFCLSLIGDPKPPPVPDVALCLRRWEGAVTRLDVALHLDRVFFSRFPHPLHHRVALAVATELAGWDVHLARHLANKSLSAIMNPFEVLCDFAVIRGWTPDRRPNESWEDGTCDFVDGARMLHSAAAAAGGNRAEVTRRVWRGQVASLYPFIEEQRVRIIPHVRGYIRLPVETTYGWVDNAEDLELGQLLYFLRGKKIQPRIWRLLSLLTEMRHSLAHLSPVPVRSLLAEEILVPEH
jgi:hypothetical protein